MWFTERLASAIGRITPDGTITEYKLPTFTSYPGGIAAGPDGNLWFTAGEQDRADLTGRHPTSQVDLPAHRDTAQASA